jgi:alpha-beta hydrolase superfamily lysophospholipase
MRALTPVKLSSADGTPLHAEVGTRPAAPRAVVLCVHGFGEHIGRYDHVAAAVAAAGYGWAAVDLRGHGHSGGRRAYIDRFGRYLEDVAALVELGRARFDGLPLFLLGHSMGGLVVTRFALDGDRGVAGLVLSSPGFRFAVEASAVKKGLGHVMSRLWPTLALPTGIPSSDLSRDPAVGRAYDADPLVNKSATARWYTECLVAQDEVRARVGAVKLPVLLLSAGEDRLVDEAESRLVFERIGSADKTYRSYPGFFHEIFNEIERDRVLADLFAWLDGHVPGRAGA